MDCPELYHLCPCTIELETFCIFFLLFLLYFFSSIFFLLLPLLVAISEEADFSLCLLILDGFDNLEKKILDF